MTTLLTADIHMTNNPRDAYRWELLPWLAEQAKKYKVDQLIIAGDLTDNKDRHPAPLVNRLVTGIADFIHDTGARVIILKGNHDCVDEDVPFFGFTDRLLSCTFLTVPCKMNLVIGSKGAVCLLLPSTRSARDWDHIDFSDADYIFTHQTYNGAKSETGFQLTGFDAKDLFSDTDAKIYSGDIHVPQIVDKTVEYIGAPYRCHFGDTYTPRVILIDDKDRAKDLHFPCPDKHLIVVRSTKELSKAIAKLPPQDQVKVRVELPRSEMATWSELKAEVKQTLAQAELHEYGVELVKLEEKSKRVKPDDPLDAVDMSAADLIKARGSRDKLDKATLQQGLALAQRAGLVGKGRSK